MWTLLTYLRNLGSAIAAIISIVRAIIALIGTEQAKNLFRLICDALTKEADRLPEPPKEEASRARLLDRVWQKISLDRLGISEEQYVAFCNMRGIPGFDPDNQALA